MQTVSPIWSALIISPIFTNRLSFKLKWTECNIRYSSQRGWFFVCKAISCENAIHLKKVKLLLVGPNYSVAISYSSGITLYEKDQQQHSTETRNHVYEYRNSVLPRFYVRKKMWQLKKIVATKHDWIRIDTH